MVNSESFHVSKTDVFTSESFDKQNVAISDLNVRELSYEEVRLVTGGTSLPIEAA